MFILEFLNLMFTTIATLFVSVFEAMFSISNTIDSVKEGIIAAALGVSAGLVSFVSIVFGIIRFFVKNLNN